MQAAVGCARTHAQLRPAREAEAPQPGPARAAQRWRACRGPEAAQKARDPARHTRATSSAGASAQATHQHERRDASRRQRVCHRLVTFHRRTQGRRRYCRCSSRMAQEPAAAGWTCEPNQLQIGALRNRSSSVAVADRLHSNQASTQQRRQPRARALAGAARAGLLHEVMRTAAPEWRHSAHPALKRTQAAQFGSIVTSRHARAAAGTRGATAHPAAPGAQLAPEPHARQSLPTTGLRRRVA